MSEPGAATERRLIEIIRRAAGRAPAVRVGIGDDCAVLEPAAGSLLLATTDLLIEDVHFRRRWATPMDIGWKSLAVNLSDIAAMGGRPRWGLIALACPEAVTVDDAEAFYSGVQALATEHDVAIVGGDTSASPGGWIINVTLLGEAVHAPLLRSTARVGDVIAVTGSLGRSAAGLALLEATPAPAGIAGEARADVTAAHLRPRPRTREGQWLSEAGGVTSMMDLSDGLATDLGHLCEESGTGARIDLGRVPLEPLVSVVARALDRDALAWATGGGEDYELLLTTSPDAFDRLAGGLARATGTKLTAVGHMTSGAEGIRYLDAAGRAVPVRPGFEHFVTGHARVPEGFGLKFFALCVLIVCSAILTGAEAAYFSLGRARLKHVAPKDEDEPVGEPKPLIERPHELLVTLLVGITVINIGAAALAATIADSIFGPTVGLFVEIIVLVFVLTTFGEVLPMTLAVKYPERFLAIAGPPVAWLGVLLAPARATLTGLTALMVRIVSRGRTEQATLSEEELRTLVDVGASEGVVEREEREMIHKVFELEDTLVRSVMVPRTDMVCLDVETPTAEILPALREHLHSRVPVYEGAIDVIVGILYAKDLLPFMEGLPPDFDLRSHLHPPYFVPESKRADALLQEFQAKRVQMAIVVDEYGGTAGLVTLEDLLEELVGEIADEYDEPERLIQRVDATTYRVAGKLPIEQLNAATGLKISNEGYDTVGGWVLDLFGRVPRRAERAETAELQLTVEKVERTRIVEVLVSLKKPAKEAAA